MKTCFPRLAACLLVVMTCSSLQAQSARKLTDRITRAQQDQANSLNPQPQAPAAPARPVIRQVAPAAPAAPVDPEKAKTAKDEATRRTIEFQKKRAEDGSGIAQYDLGLRYLKGDGVEKDEVKARKWLEEASKNGIEAAGKRLAELDKAKPKDPTKPAEQATAKLAEKDSAKAADKAEDKPATKPAVTK